MLKPKKTKYRKYQKGTIKSSRKNVLFIDTLKEGVFRLDSQQSARITAKQLESCRQSISRRIKRLGLSPNNHQLTNLVFHYHLNII